MRSVVALLLVLPACDREAATRPAPRAGIAAPCALSAAAEFTNDCRVVRTVVDGRTVLTFIAPDGGFRRLEVGVGGSGIVAADGAIPARTRADGKGGVEVAIADDRYRLPATP